MGVVRMDSESNWAGGLLESRQGSNLVQLLGPGSVRRCPGLGQASLYPEFALVHCGGLGEGNPWISFRMYSSHNTVVQWFLSYSLLSQCAAVKRQVVGQCSTRRCSCKLKIFVVYGRQLVRSE